MNAPVPIPTLAPAAGRERLLVLVVAAVQLVNVLEFMIVMPLGPDFARALGFPLDAVGLVGGSYTAAAAAAGLAGAVLLDRFDRRRALLTALAGLVVSTVLAGLARDLPSLLAARLLAGLCGGPATSLSLAIVSDLVPPERRGRAMAMVMGAFSVASIAGVPLALELARLVDWRAPFFAVALLGLLALGLAAAVLPAMRTHLEPGARSSGVGLIAVVRRPESLLSLAAVALSMATMFTIVPNLSAYLQFNAGWPRERLGLLYFGGGAASLALMAVSGRLTDRLGATPVLALSAVGIATVMGLGLLPGRPLIPTVVFFVLFMGTSSIRGVAMTALTSRVPPLFERARYQSVQSAAQHLAAAAGAVGSTAILRELPDGSLAGMEGLAAAAMAATLSVPLLARAVEWRVRARERSGAH